MLAREQPVASYLLHLPVAVSHVACHFVPWWDRLLHLSHVHRQLPPVWLEWTERDHVRLSEALLLALEQQQPSAVRWARCAQSLCVEQAMSDKLMPYEFEASSAPSRLRSCLRALGRIPSAAPPFGKLRSLVSPAAVLSQLLEANDQLSDLHSVWLYWPSNDITEEEAAMRPLDECWQSLPALRRARADNRAISVRTLAALPHIECVDCDMADFAESERPLIAAPSPSLRRLLCPIAVRLPDGQAQVELLLRTLAPVALEHLNLYAQLSHDALDALASLRSLTALELFGCNFHAPDALVSRLVSSHSQPLLPCLTRLALSFHTGREADRTYRATAALLRAYGPQLQHLHCANHDEGYGVLPFLLPVVLFDTPQLVSLRLDAWTRGEREERPAIVLPDATDVPPHRQPALTSLLSLTLSDLHATDAELALLLACTPRLMELSLLRLPELTAAVWRSVLQCRELRSCRVHAASELATAASLAFHVPLLPVTASPPSPVACPHLSQLDWSFTREEHVDPSGITRLLSIFHGSPVTHFTFHMPLCANHYGLVRELAAVPRGAAVRLEVERREGRVYPLDDDEEDEHRQSGASVLQLLEQCSQPLRVTSEQHSLAMEHLWQSERLGEDEAAMRAKYAAGLKPLPLLSSGYRQEVRMMVSSGWREFKRAQIREDGRAMFFRLLEESGHSVDSI